MGLTHLLRRQQTGNLAGLALCLLGACGAPGTMLAQDSGLADAGDGGPGMVPVPKCQLVLPGLVEASEGGRTLITVRTEPPGGRIDPGTLPDGVRTAWRGEGLLDIKVPYGVSERK